MSKKSIHIISYESCIPVSVEEVLKQHLNLYFGKQNLQENNLKNPVN